MPFRKGHKINIGNKHHLGKKHSKDSKDKMRIAKHKNPIKYWLGKNISDESKKMEKESPGERSL